MAPPILFSPHLPRINRQLEMLDRAVQPDEVFPILRLFQDQHNPSPLARLQRIIEGLA